MTHEGRVRRETLRQALEATRAAHRVQAQGLEAAMARLQAITEWIETGRPQREILRESAMARLQARLESQPVIEQAKGIIMAEQRCGPEEAFGLLRRASQRANLKVHTLAAQIVAHVAPPSAEAGARSTPAHLNRGAFPRRPELIGCTGPAARSAAVEHLLTTSDPAAQDLRTGQHPAAPPRWP